jgi:hypothetical protein
MTARTGRPRPRYTLHFEWPKARPPGAIHAHLLLGDDLDDARVEAAIIYAGLDYETLPPAYRIVCGSRRVVYRYPEPGCRAVAAR